MSNLGIIRVEPNLWKAIDSPDWDYVHQRLLLPNDYVIENINKQEDCVDIFVRSDSIPEGKASHLPWLKPVYTHYYDFVTFTSTVKLDHIEAYFV